jgi:hypothetical protein
MPYTGLISSDVALHRPQPDLVSRGRTPLPSPGAILPRAGFPPQKQRSQLPHRPNDVGAPQGDEGAVTLEVVAEGLWSKGSRTGDTTSSTGRARRRASRTKRFAARCSYRQMSRARSRRGIASARKNAGCRDIVRSRVRPKIEATTSATASGTSGGDRLGSAVLAARPQPQVGVRQGHCRPRVAA